mgnify:CR=1 FL=1
MKFSKSKANKKAISFYSHHLNKEKLNTIKEFAKKNKILQNHISYIYFDEYFNKQTIKCTDFIKLMNKRYRDKDFSSMFFQHICKQVYEKYNKKKPPKNQVVFKKLSFIGVNQSTKIFIEESSNKYTNGIINLNIPHFGIIEIPFRYSKKYHGNLNDINYSMTGMNQYQKQYTCTVEKDRLKIVIVEDDNRIYPISNGNHIEGIDVNIKHNLLQCSDGYTIDYDRKMVKSIFKRKKKQDRITSTKTNRGLSTEYTYKQLKQNQKDKRRSISMVEQCLVELFKHCNENNIDHLVFEDLNKFTRRYKINNKEFNVNIRRLMSILHIVDIKNMAERIGKKYGITISLTNAEYTSQQCSKCGYIHKDNRKTQEKFKCIHCGYEENADLNASINIRERIKSDVLRDSLHIEVEKNKYIPLETKHEKIEQLFKKLNLVA